MRRPTASLLTAQEVYDVMRRLQREQGRPGSLREIIAAAGGMAMGSFYWRLRQLQRRGRIRELSASRSRSARCYVAQPAPEEWPTGSQGLEIDFARRQFRWEIK